MTLPQYALVVYREGHQTFNLEGGVQFSARVPNGPVVYRIGQLVLNQQSWVQFPVGLPNNSSPSLSGTGRHGYTAT